MPVDEAVGTGTGAQAAESLSCVTCRNRKLKCDRLKPVCTRCAKVNGECSYPESRRKPAFKRRNVKELEARLAQVEVLLKEAGEGSKETPSNVPVEEAIEPTGLIEPVEPVNVNFDALEIPMTDDVLFQGLDYAGPDMLFDNTSFAFNQNNPSSFSANAAANEPSNTTNAFDGQLMDLGGLFETLPPFEIMEDLNRIFFERQQMFVPIIHPARYLQAFYSAPHMKPPMSLQYSIWALASNSNPKYHGYHDVFYRRARQYADSDEMKGHGEHFITIQHAQAWCIIATDEAKSMMFTRAAMSCARGVRLVEMLGLHRLDSPPDETCPTLLPPNDWAELEERRRTFWGMFCIDSHCSISTGWPHLIDPTDVTTHLPTNEAAFHSGKEMKTCSLHDAFKGHSYSSFAATILVCNLFNQILRHVHRPKPSDCPENYEFGGFWQRHREIDNMLSSAFMFLPENFRLPEHYCDPTAVHTNLNLHASVICLHHAAIEKIDMHKLPEHAKTISQNRLRTSAQEIVNIMKLTSHVASNPKTPLASLSLYCAASVYIYFCEETQTPTNVDNLDFILAAMESFARSHVITRAFLRQVLLDIECNRVQDLIRLPRVNDLLEGSIGSLVSHNIPLLARTRVARHSKAQPVLPGRLPLGRPVGKIISDKMHSATNDVTSLKEADSFLQDPDYENSSSEGNANKRKRTAASTLDSSSDLSDPLWNKATPSSHSSPQNSVNPAAIQSHVYEPGIGGAVSEVRLPHRVGSPSTSSNFQSFSRAQKMASPLQSTAVRSESNMFGDFASMPTTTEGKTQATLLDGGQGALDSWDPGSMDMYSQFVDKIGGDINKTANMMDKNSQFNF